MRFYIAAPFFNPAQIAVVEQIEQIFTEANTPYFSPRSQDSNKASGPIDAARAMAIFAENVTQMHHTDATLAVVDWAMPDGQEVRIVLPHHGCASGDLISTPLNLPDTGTVWEMGFTFAMGKPLFVYTTRPPEQGLNLMLTQGAVGVVRGPEGLRQFLKDGTVETWTGKNR